MIRNLQAQMLMLLALAGDLMDTTRARLSELCSEPERGGGKGSMEEILLAVGGVIAAGVVVAAIGAAIAAATGKLG
jgi:hypothetical protein